MIHEISFSQIQNVMVDFKPATTNHDEIVYNINQLSSYKQPPLLPNIIILVLKSDEIPSYPKDFLIQHNIQIYTIYQQTPIQKNDGVLFFYTIQYICSIWKENFNFVVSYHHIPSLIELEKSLTIQPNTMERISSSICKYNGLYFQKQNGFHHKWEQPLFDEHKVYYQLSKPSYYSNVELNDIYIESKQHANNIQHLNIYLPIDKTYIQTYQPSNPFIFLNYTHSNPLQKASIYTFLKYSKCNIILLNKHTISYWWDKKTNWNLSLYYTSDYYYSFMKYTWLSMYGGIWIQEYSFNITDMSSIYSTFQPYVTCIQFKGDNDYLDTTIIHPSSEIPSRYLSILDSYVENPDEFKLSFLYQDKEEKDIKIYDQKEIVPYSNEVYLSSSKRVIDLLNSKSSFPLYFILILDSNKTLSRFYTYINQLYQEETFFSELLTHLL